MNQFNALSGKRFLVTGHNGFKGTWLCRYLEILGVDVFGFSLAPTDSSLYLSTQGLDDSHEHIGDINNYEEIRDFVRFVNPDVVIHMAAQALVIPSYQNPRQTFQTNVMGTINVLESALDSSNMRGFVAVTTDKVYENSETGLPFVESDPKGGHDPYSGSKAAMEMALNSWQYFYSKKNLKLVAARAGNVVGMGDRSVNRLLPDLIATLKSGQDINLRNPQSVRPWQHVLEPLSGYLKIAERVLSGKSISKAYNFGPQKESHRSVLDVAKIATSFWGSSSKIQTHDLRFDFELPEAKILKLDSTLAENELGWTSKLSAQEAIELTLSGEKSLQFEKADEIIAKQIREYLRKK